jgi:NAD(P)H-nitrite reductase large subunit
MTDQYEEIICDCSGTTKAKIHQLINDGRDSFEKIAAATGAGTGCGSCDVLIMDILAEKNIDTLTDN